MPYFDAGTYNTLYNILAGDEELAEYAGQFASYFTVTEDGYYQVKDLAAYQAWLNTLLDGEDTSDWLAWSGVVSIKSTQGGGKN